MNHPFFNLVQAVKHIFSAVPVRKRRSSTWLAIETLEARVVPSGANVTSAVFTGVVQNTFDRVTLTFNETIDPTSFTTSDVSLIDPNGKAIGINAVSKGSSSTVFEVTFPSQTTFGDYTITTGVNILDLAGNQMNQNQNGINGEVPPTSPDDLFRGSATLSDANDKTGASVTSAVFTGVVQNTFDRVTLTFNETIDPTSFTTSDVSLIDPNGKAIGINAVSKGSSSNVFEVTFPSQATFGDYTITTGVNILDLAGNQMNQNQNGINGEVPPTSPDDLFRASTTLFDPNDKTGASVTSAVFTGSVANTFDKVTLTFSEAINASGFTTDDIAGVLDPNGNFISVTSVSPIAGMTNQFDVAFVPQSAFGQYTIVTTTGITDLAGNELDQNQNGVNGEPSDQFVGSATLSDPNDKTGASVTSAVFTGSVANTFDKVTLTFSEAMQPSTLSLTDITLAGPGGAISITGITVVAGSNNTQFDVTFAPQSAFGDYTITTGVNILDLAGNQMNQNQNGINGEVPPTSPDDLFRASATLSDANDKTGAVVTSAVFSGAVQNTFNKVTLTFNEPMQASTVNTTNITLTGPGGVIGIANIAPVAGSNTKYDVTFASQSATGAYTIIAGVNILDVAGNQLNQNGVAPNGQGGPPPTGDQFSATQTLTSGNGTDTTGAQITNAVFTGATTGTFDTITLTFSEAVQASTVTTTNITLSGPGGAITPTGINAVVGSNNTKYDVTIASQSVIGDYTLNAAVGILDVAGNQLTQPFSVTRTLTTTGGGGGTPRVVAIGQSDGSIKIIDGVTNEVLVANFRPLDANGQLYKSTVAVAAGDLDGDGTPELFVAAQKRAGIAGLDDSKAGKVFVYNAATVIDTGSVTPFDTITPFATNFDGTQTYETGFELGTGDVNGDGTVDLIAGSRGDVGQISVMSGVGTDSGHARLGSIVTPFGANYRGKVLVTGGNFIAETGTQNDEVAAARGNTDSTDSSRTGTTTRVAMFDLAGSSLNPVTFSGAIAADGTPSQIQGSAGQVIDRNAFVASIDLGGTGPDLLLFAARDFVSNPNNAQIRVAVYGVSANGSANLQSSNADGDGGSYLVGNQVGSYAIARSDIDGDGADSLAMVVDGPSAGVLYLAPLTGADLGGLTTPVLTGGVRIASD